MREAELLILTSEDFKADLRIITPESLRDVLEKLHWPDGTPAGQWVESKITEVHEPLKDDAQPLVGFKRVSNIKIEGSYVPTPKPEPQLREELFEHAELGQVLNIVTSKRTLKFVLVQIDIP